METKFKVGDTVIIKASLMHRFPTNTVGKIEKVYGASGCYNVATISGGKVNGCQTQLTHVDDLKLAGGE